jgi:hypothetical protein
MKGGCVLTGVSRQGCGGGSRPVSRLLCPGRSPGVAAIHLGPALPPASCGPPGDSAGPASAAAMVAAVRPLFDLAPGGVYRAGRSPGRWCALTAPFHPCHAPGSPGPFGGLFSVALSCGSPRLAVSQHPALWRPDFPRSRRTGTAAAQPTPCTTGGSAFTSASGETRTLTTQVLDLVPLPIGLRTSGAAGTTRTCTMAA